MDRVRFGVAPDCVAQVLGRLGAGITSTGNGIGITAPPSPRRRGTEQDFSLFSDTFLTFDKRQAKLARAAGLAVAPEIRPGKS